MSINNIFPVNTGQAGIEPSWIYIDTDDSTETVLTANYLTPAKDIYGNVFSNKQMALISVVDSGSVQTITAEVHVALDGNVSLEVPINPGNVTLPVVSGDFAVFDGTTGKIKDAGFSPTNATKTKVVMATGAVTANHIATYTDTAGTLGQDATVAVNHGAIQSGSATGGSSGSINVYPATAASGILRLAPVDNTVGDFEAIINNIATLSQTTSYILSDPEQGTCSILVSRLSAADSNSNLWAFDVTATAAELVSGGAVGITDLILGSARYKIRAMWLNSGGTNFSGGGDRDIEVADAATVYTVIPATVAQSLVNAGWGSTEIPYPASAPINETITSSLFIRYSGGTTDYPTGSLTISGILERVA